MSKQDSDRYRAVFGTKTLDVLLALLTIALAGVVGFAVLIMMGVLS